MGHAVHKDEIRINLGCGRKVLAGWINVDTASRGVTPDINSDVRKLPFENNYADVVMAIHLVEHFYAWEIVDVLKEWIRVLKPGGKLIIECPDILKTAEFIIKGRNEPHLTMWPLYGDPSHKDPLMCHKWGYTPHSLKRLLEYVGLNDVEHKSAEFHMKNVRDMRIEAIKC